VLSLEVSKKIIGGGRCIGKKKPCRGLGEGLIWEITGGERKGFRKEGGARNELPKRAKGKGPTRGLILGG